MDIMPNEPIHIAQSKEPIYLLPKMSNRHGLVAGATGTGKTVTLQTLAENFSARGVPVFMADVKGDLAGMSQTGGNNPKIVERATEEQRGTDVLACRKDLLDPLQKRFGRKRL